MSTLKYYSNIYKVDKMVFDIYKMRCSIFEDEVETVYIDEDGEFHRENGPAVVTQDAKYYYIHGKLHRENGPAVMTPTTRIWCKDGLIHRLSGPAIISKSHGYNGYWVVNGYHVKNDLNKWLVYHNIDPEKMSDEDFCILHLTWDKYSGDSKDYISYDDIFIY